MESSGTTLWRQFGAAIDMLDNAVAACPAPLWRGRLWSIPPDGPLAPEFAEFWYLSYHTLFWLDLYLSGPPEEAFTPPAPFSRAELDPGALPDRPYTKEELRAYLVATRQKCRSTLVALSDAEARRPVAYPRVAGEPMSFLERQLYNLRHVQEHAAQLSLFLGQHAIPDEALDWVARAKDDAGSA